MRSHNECVIQMRNFIVDIVNNLIASICNYEINSQNNVKNFFHVFSGRILLDIPCKVCQDHSSGKHYGIFACDG